MIVTDGLTTRTQMCEWGHPSSRVCNCHCCGLSHTYEAERVDGLGDAELLADRAALPRLWS
jgi:hypothetical protein